MKITAALTKDLEQTRSSNAMILSSGPEGVLLLYSEWANESWTTTLHTMIASLSQPDVLHDCGLVLMPAEAADVAVAQARRPATAQQTNTILNQAAVDDLIAKKTLSLAACLLRHRCWSMVWHSEARSFATWSGKSCLAQLSLACKPV